MAVTKIKDLRDALTASGFTGDQAARIIAADMIAAQMADLNRTLKDLKFVIQTKKF